MVALRALVVDDDAWVRRNAEEAVAEGIEILTAGSKEHGAELAADHFLHVAIVDLELRTGNRALGEGRMLLRELKDARPSCRRVLLTKHATSEPEFVFEMLKPESPVVSGAIDKDELSGYLHNYLRALAVDWLRSPIRVTNLEEIFNRLSEQKIVGSIPLGMRDVRITTDELYYILSSAFGQRLRSLATGPEPDDIDSITLTPLPGGKSGSLVLYGRPIDRLGGSGLPTVVKVGTREDAEEELRRYEQFVRHRMPLKRRIELLGHAIGDTIGAIAYSFAGDEPTGVKTLQALLDRSDDTALAHFSKLFDDGPPWGEQSSETRDLGEYFKQAHDLKLREVSREIKEQATTLGAKRGWERSDGRLRVPGGELLLPTDESAGRGLLHMGVRTAIVHGDLNGSNVIIGDDGASTLIDYRHTTRGPRLVDFAAMQASIRLSAGAVGRPEASVGADEAAEYALWAADRRPDPERKGAEQPFWSRAALCLMGLTAELLPDVTRAEHAATCWLFGLRLYRVSSVADAERLRLLIWLSGLERVLREEEASDVAAAT